MLGEKIGQESGKVTSRRVLGVDGAPTIEISFAAEGTMLGVKHRSLGTYSSTIRPDGTVFGTGQGVSMGAGGEMASWKGSGVGILNAKGGADFRGALFYQSASPAWASLNKVVAVFEYKENADGSTQSETWEWK
jgi:hypothetical protein